MPEYYSRFSIFSGFNDYIYLFVVYLHFYYLLNFVVKFIGYSKISILISVLLGMLFVYGYISFVFNTLFRVIIIFMILLIVIIEIVKHRNNYDSFKEPWYSIIVKYLK